MNCPECGKECQNARAVGIHRALKHGTAGSSPSARFRALAGGAPQVAQARTEGDVIGLLIAVVEQAHADNAAEWLQTIRGR